VLPGWESVPGAAEGEGGGRVKTPRAVYRFGEMVMVFDAWGEQIPALQGRFLEVKERILQEADAHTEFYAGNWRTRQSQELTLEEWRELSAS
jgi:hypothetical protein